jgi:hypothetical protein
LKLVFAPVNRMAAVAIWTSAYRKWRVGPPPNPRCDALA